MKEKVNKGISPSGMPCIPASVSSIPSVPYFSMNQSTQSKLMQVIAAYCRHFFRKISQKRLAQTHLKIRNAYSARISFRSRSKVFQGVPRCSKPFQAFFRNNIFFSRADWAAVVHPYQSTLHSMATEAGSVSKIHLLFHHPTVL
jgi:hypothetical protein